MLSYIEIDPSQTHHRAFLTTAVSVLSAGVAHLSHFHELVQTIAGVVAIGSGCMAIAYYYVSILEKLRKSRGVQ